MDIHHRAIRTLDDVSAATKTLAVVGAVSTAAGVVALQAWPGEFPRASLRIFLLQLVVAMFLPFVCALAAWLRGRLVDLMVVSVACSVGHALGLVGYFLKATLDRANWYAPGPPIALDDLLAQIFASFTRSLAVGCALALAFTVYQLWPAGRDRLRQREVMEAALTSVAAAVFAYVAMYYVFEWVAEAPASNARIYPLYAAQLGLPIAFALRSLLRDKNGAAMVIALVTSLAIAAPPLVRFVRQVADFPEFPKDLLVASIATSAISVTAMGMAPVLAFIAWRFWKLDSDAPELPEADFARPEGAFPDLGANQLVDPAAH